LACLLAGGFVVDGLCKTPQKRYAESKRFRGSRIVVTNTNSSGGGEEEEEEDDDDDEEAHSRRSRGKGSHSLDTKVLWEESA